MSIIVNSIKIDIIQDLSFSKDTITKNSFYDNNSTTDIAGQPSADREGTRLTPDQIQ